MQAKPPEQSGTAPREGKTSRLTVPPGRLKGLGVVFLLGLYHEVSQATAAEDRAASAVQELLQILQEQPGSVATLIELLAQTYPEIADQLLNADGQTADLVLDPQALADQLLELEASGYLEREETQRLLASLRSLDAVMQGADEGDVQLAQAGAGAASDAGAAGAAAGSEGAADIETLPPTGAGPAALALGPFIGASAVGAVAANNLYTPSTKDTTAPAALTFSLAVDTGASGTDGITSDGRVNVAGLEAGASWQYSLDGGSQWLTGTGTSFTLAAASYGAGAVQVRQIDAAGNMSAVTSSGAAIVVDTTAPQAQSLTQASATQLVLNYSSALDAVNVPAASAFAVTADGVAVAVSSITVAGSSVTLNLATALTTGQSVSITYTDPAGDTANAVQDIAGNDAVTITTGKVADGYVRGAQIYVDGYNGGAVNGQPDAAELVPGVVTDANGNFFLPDGLSGTIFAQGGVSIDTGVPNTMTLKAPSGSTMITPLTTLVQAYAEANGVTAAQANAAVLDVLNLPTTIDLSTYDPLAVLSASGAPDATALAVQKATAQVATLVEAAAAAPAAGVSAQTVSNNVIQNLLGQIETAHAGGTSVDLTSTATLTSVLSGTGSTVTVAAVETATDAIAAATTLDAVVVAQAEILDTISPAPPSGVTLVSDSGVLGDGITNTTTPTVRVSLNVSATDGSAAVAGNTVTVLSGGTAVASVTLTATHIANGYVDIAVAGLPVNVGNSLQATVTDVAAHTSGASSALSFTIDTAAPAAPAFALAVDSGVSASDGITNNGSINVSGLEPGAGWQYSTDGGAHWSDGAGSSFALPGTALYETGAVQVRQIDVAGNVGAAAASTANITVGLGTPLDIDSAHEASTLAALAAQGNADGYLHTLNLLDGTVTLTDAQASALVSAGLEFAADDLGVTVQGTQLHTSLSGLQALGVDTLGITAATGQTVVDLGSGAVDFAHLPTVSSAGASVGLGVQAGDAALLTSGNAAALDTAGFSFVDVAGNAITLTDAQASALVSAGLAFASNDTGVTVQGPHFSNSLGELQALGVDTLNITTGGGPVSAALADLTASVVSLTDAQATVLVDAGLAFADAQVVSVDHAHAAGTHLNTSLADLQHLGVDFVHTPAGTDTVVLDASTGPIPSLTALPVFDSEDHVKLVTRDSQVADMATFIENYNTSVGINPHIDELSVVLRDALGSELGGSGVLTPAFGGMGVELDVANNTIPEITLGMILEAADGSADPLATLTGATLRNALQAAGIDIHIDDISTFRVADTDLKPLLDAGLISADGGAEVRVTNADGTLDVTLAQLAAIGADQVQVTGGSVTLDAGVTFTDATGLETALTNLLATYEAQAGGSVSGVFTSGDTVNLTVAGTVGGTLPAGYQLSDVNPALVTKLELLGIDNIVDDQGHSIK